MFSGQSLGGRETGHKKNGKHVTKLADSLLGWRLDLDESSPCSSKRQAETTVGAAGNKFDDFSTINLDGVDQIKFGSIPWRSGGTAGDKFDDSTTVNLDGDEQAKFGSVPWRSGLHYCTRRRH